MGKEVRQAILGSGTLQRPARDTRTVETSPIQPDEKKSALQYFGMNPEWRQPPAPALAGSPPNFFPEAVSDKLFRADWSSEMRQVI